MATPAVRAPTTIEYPTRDGRPMGETDLYRKDINDLIESLDIWYEDDPLVYVSGNLLLYYVPGNKRRHVSPDVFVVRGVTKLIQSTVGITHAGIMFPSLAGSLPSFRQSRTDSPLGQSARSRESSGRGLRATGSRTSWGCRKRIDTHDNSAWLTASWGRATLRSLAAGVRFRLGLAVARRGLGPLPLAE